MHVTMGRMPLRSLRPSTRPPILVTGVPRSGTTWLARQLALAPGTALAGREPMNPRGSQYGLGGTVHGWTQLTDPSRHQRALIRAAYLGLNPLVYSRYGVRQWAAPMPGVRMVVKDPFGLLSIGTLHAQTGARAVVVVRHPGAILASYRRMGWSPDLEELDPIAQATLGTDRALSPSDDAAADMAAFWAALHDLAMEDIDATDAVVVFHEDIATGGVEAGRLLYQRLGLRMTPATQRRWAPEVDKVADAARLHNLDRNPKAVANGWRAATDETELATLERVAGSTLEQLRARALDLGG